MSTQDNYTMKFAGVLMVHLMEFDYDGKHYSYHGRKLENAVARLTHKEGPQKATKAELFILGRACNDWNQINS